MLVVAVRGSHAALVVGWAITLLVGAYVGSLIVRRGSGFVALWDVAVCCAGFAACAAAVWARAWIGGPDRAVFVALAAAITSYTLGTIAYNTATWLDVQPGEPSLADVGYLGFIPLLATALILQVRRTPGGLNARLMLDALMSTAGAAAGMAVLVAPILVDQTAAASTPVTVWTASAYPVGDVMLIAGVVGLLSLPRSSDSPHWVLIAAGLGLFVLADVIYAVRTLADVYALGEPVDGLWLLGVYVMTLGAWVRPGPTQHRYPGGDRWALAAPMTALVVAVAVLVVASTIEVPTGAVWLATATLALVVIRTMLGFRDLRRLADAETLAVTDPLTGLHNRRYAFHALQVLADNRPRDAQLIVLIIDIDHFKSVNDTRGHAAGDAVLRSVSAAIQRCLRPGDLAARIGGDEFLVASLHDQPTAPTATQAGDAIAQRIRSAVSTGDQQTAVTVSVGVAVGPQAAESVDSLIARADRHMYHVKRQRRP